MRITHVVARLDVVIYARISTEDQKRGYSIGDQSDWGRDLSARNGWQCTDEYKDEGFHSDTVDRPELRRLCEDVASGKVHCILLRYADRLGRGMTFSKLVEWLKAWGVRIVCGDLPDAGDATDLLLSIYGTQGGQQLELLRNRTKDGVLRAKKAGKQIGNELAGFHWEDGKWVPEEWTKEAYAERNMPLSQLAFKHHKKPWTLRRAIEAMDAWERGTLDELVGERSRASLERYRLARQRQEERARNFERWLLDHRPITLDRVRL